MRRYICTITRENNHDNYVYTKTIEDAHHWETEKLAEDYLRFVLASGETIFHPPFSKVGGVCTDFRIEPQPQGGFAISCEQPLH